ncbi:MAG: TatD family hydrolase [Gluconacetobacter diazotrophicus]|nr:TatD family hydrolase [Gluconacetobacter diazotrophicus]
MPDPTPGGGSGLIDSHCHLDLLAEQGGEDAIPAALDAAAASGLSGMVTIGTRLSNAATNRALCAHSRPELRVWCTVGTHPDNAHDEPLPEPEAIAALAAAPEVIGIGESGLDHFHGAPEVRPAQERGFRAHIRAARLANVPLVVHARAADADVERVLREEHASGGPFPFLLHCFSSGEALARCGIELGGSVSFSGILTFPKSGALRELAASLPRDRLLVETDAPFLAPVPHRGRRNQPAFVRHTAAVLGTAIGLDEAAVARLTTDNFFRLFPKAAA